MMNDSQKLYSSATVMPNSVKVSKFSVVIVGGNFATLEDFQKMLRPGLNQFQIADGVKGMIQHRPLGPGSVRAGFSFDELSHYFSPIAFDETWICRSQICFGNLQIYGGLLASLIFRFDEAASGGGVGGLEALRCPVTVSTK